MNYSGAYVCIFCIFYSGTDIGILWITVILYFLVGMADMYICSLSVTQTELKSEGHHDIWGICIFTRIGHQCQLLYFSPHKFLCLITSNG